MEGRAECKRLYRAFVCKVNELRRPCEYLTVERSASIRKLTSAWNSGVPLEDIFALTEEHMLVSQQIPDELDSVWKSYMNRLIKSRVVTM
tara:strand:+ start:350 stop:619 length:270 start_codon:yes stop_codon:yes gene_type:complete